MKILWSQNREFDFVVPLLFPISKRCNGHTMHQDGCRAGIAQKLRIYKDVRPGPRALFRCGSTARRFVSRQAHLFVRHVEFCPGAQVQH